MLLVTSNMDKEKKAFKLQVKERGISLQRTTPFVALAVNDGTQLPNHQEVLMLLLQQIQPFDLITDIRNNNPLRVLDLQPTDEIEWQLTVSGSHGLIRQLTLQSNNKTYLSSTAEQRLVRDPDALLGCLLGGALGDACGAPVEFLEWAQIQQRFGKNGIQDLQPAYGKLGVVTDDTQMMLFTADGLLRACVREYLHGTTHAPSIIHNAYMRWLVTQNEQPSQHITNTVIDGWLIQDQRLWQRRTPSITSLQALQTAQQLGDMANNTSKDCGGIMRVAPCAFMPHPFTSAAQAAHLTHGHPSGYLAAGLFADILARLWLTPNLSLVTATHNSLHEHRDKTGMHQTYNILQKVLKLHSAGIKPTPQLIETELGGGWIAEETLAIGLWCALSAENFTDGVCKAVNHSGDSDSTGLITGHFLGLLLGVKALPSAWLDHLEMRDSIQQIATDLCLVPHQARSNNSSENAALWQRYPGW